MFLGLSGTGDRPTAKATLAAALLHALVSTELWAEANTERDLMRDLFGAFPAMRAALELAGLGAEAEAYAPRVRALAAAAELLWRVKRDGRDEAWAAVCGEVVRTLRVGGTAFLLDAPLASAAAAAVQQEGTGVGAGGTALRYTLLKHNTVHAGLRLGAVALPLELGVAPGSLLEPLADMAIGSNYCAAENEDDPELKPPAVAVCPRTLRPYTQVGCWRG